MIRAKSNLQFNRLDYQEVGKTLGLRADQRIVLAGKKSKSASLQTSVNMILFKRPSLTCW